MILFSEEKITQYTRKGWWGSRTLIDYFKQQARVQPDRVAIADPLNKEALLGRHSERLTYRDLDRRIDGLATGLLGLGLQKDDFVLVQLPNCWELAALYLAISRAGGIITPVPLQWRARELSYVAQLTGARFAVVADEFKGFCHKKLAEEVQSRVRTLKEIVVYDRLQEFCAIDPDLQRLGQVPLDANDIFTLCWTSGTEAEPKGCPLSHNNWLALARLQADLVIKPGDVLLTAGPLVNMASVGTSFIPWILLGGTFVLHHPFEPRLFIQQMMQEDVNYTLLVPAVANMLVKHPQVDHFDLRSVRSITLGSAMPSLFSMQEFKRRWDVDIGNIWGQNEGTGIISSPRDVPDIKMRVDHLPKFGTPGVKWSSEIATNWIRTKLVSPETGKEVTTAGEVGELAYKSPSVIPGYFRRDELTARSFDEQGFFYTGDLFVLRENNFISFFERKKDIIIRGGFNISAQEVENAVLSHPKVLEAAAIGMPDDVLGERTCIFVVPVKGENITLTEVVDFLKQEDLAVYKLPERLEVMDSLPRNPVGKLLKKELRDVLEQRMAER